MKEYIKLNKEAERKQMVKLSIMNGNKANKIVLFEGSRNAEKQVKSAQNLKAKKYNGNASDSDDENVKGRRRVEEKYRNRGSMFNDDEKKIINYIIQKKSPVYGFVDFLSKKKHQRESIKIIDRSPITRSPNSSKEVNIYRDHKYINSKEIK